jgi:hypothetical protein
MPTEVYADLWRHLLFDSHGQEQAAFMFVREYPIGKPAVFRHLEWAPILPEGFEYRSEAYLELTDEARAKIIKRAHDLGACLVELHSHTGPWPAAFSWSDIKGFREFVPHVRWRLKWRPYFAVVVARTGFDGFAWVDEVEEPSLLAGIYVGPDLLVPTGISRWDGYNND